MGDIHSVGWSILLAEVTREGLIEQDGMRRRLQAGASLEPQRSMSRQYSRP
jgi:hypothetical protein